MTFFKKILSAAVVATFAMSVAATSASAHNPNNYKSPGGIFPALFGPVGVAAAVGTTATSFSWFTTSNVWQKVWVPGKFIKVKFGWHWKKIYIPGHKKWVQTKVKVKHTKSGKSTKNMGKAVVGCIMGSAFGAITASIRKASAMGNPPRWRSQAEHERIVASGVEKKYELTNDEAQTALAYCGAGSLMLHWPRSGI